MIKLKEGIKLIVGILIGILLGLCISVSAATLIASNNVTYNNSNTSAKDVKSALDELYNKSTLSNLVKPGDYIQMTPDSTSYTISKDLTGYTADQTINPSELSLWRVLKVNEDGSIDLTSEYLSSKKITIQGYKGFLNYSTVLSNLSSAYRTKYTYKTRAFGGNPLSDECENSGSLQDMWGLCDNIVSTISSCSKFTGSCSLSLNEWEKYFNMTAAHYDALLISDALKTTAAKVYGQTYRGDYFYLLERYGYSEASRNVHGYIYYVQADEDYFFDTEEILHVYGTVDEIKSCFPSESCSGNSYSAYIRPIITLNPNITEFTGKGTASEPYVLS